MIKKDTSKPTTLADKKADAKELCLSRLRTVPREKREAAAEAILALADPEWWELRPRGADVFMLILEARKAQATAIINAAGK
ncbi:hypothetical protein GTA51_14565 [Desulfovibrio aerotolerans]|uniref:Uncharacterized protein n=1 Tax=Solidesulfovibrio aerotolerans TaxID=295255 RepID=A0A7C9MGL4_9BACT|nr:hypothetical protein [Solidesulfovibrio aerotolerans]MYL84350.1 hypothetical protein [Solidesulfovibrio aerotolerans]